MGSKRCYASSGCLSRQLFQTVVPDEAVLDLMFFIDK